VRHHFIAFVQNSKGQLVELDGCKVGPHIVIEGCTDVLKETAKELLKRVEAGKISESLAVLTLSKKPDEG
jgi:hypothetical protein